YRPRRNGTREALDLERLSSAEGPARRQLRQQRDAEPGGHHLTQRLETGGTVVFAFFRLDAAADIERLIAQAMAILEQEQCLAVQVIELDGRLLRKRAVVRHRHCKRFLVQLARFESVEWNGEREDAELDLSCPQFLEKRLRLILV